MQVPVLFGVSTRSCSIGPPLGQFATVTICVDLCECPLSGPTALHFSRALEPETHVRANPSHVFQPCSSSERRPHETKPWFYNALRRMARHSKRNPCVSISIQNAANHSQVTGHQTICKMQKQHCPSLATWNWSRQSVHCDCTARAACRFFNNLSRKKILYQTLSNSYISTAT